MICQFLLLVVTIVLKNTHLSIFFIQELSMQLKTGFDFKKNQMKVIAIKGKIVIETMESIDMLDFGCLILEVPFFACSFLCH